MLKKAVVFASGNGSNFQAIVDASKAKEIDVSIELLICNNEDAYVIERAINSGIDTLLVDYKKYTYFEIESMLIKQFKEMKIDYIFLAGFLRKLSPYFVTHFKNKILNIHPSLLPKYKGLDAIEQALANKDKEIGVTVHYVDEKLDNGPIIIQEEINIMGIDSEQVYQNVHELEHRLYIEAINKVMEE
ncbi:phosphoribosylglycinamide formyltransferase [Erysipelotrichaceae bacterium OttesenSCG-928-M19]|nr:phosphoribosylglycinamide formyltransferase [Erysipelotrichaceae bacterium OttesenSCG-928-M19]